MTPTRAAILAVVLAALAGCGGCDSVPTNAVQDCSQSQVFGGHVKTDILFVVDDSGSMSEEQANLATNLGAFINRLASLPIEDDYQIGVTTTDVENFNGSTQFSAGHPYPQGALVAVTPGTPGSFIYSTATYPATNGWGGPRILVKGSPTLVQDFNANVHVGTAGSGKEQPFRAIKMALTDRIQDGTNAGFLRPGARLAVIVLSDEDDCSDSSHAIATTEPPGNDECHTLSKKQTVLDSVPEFASFLQGPIQGEQRDVVVGAIVGVSPGTLDLACTTPSVCSPTPPATCTTCCSTCYDRGDRDTWLLDAMGPARSRLASICDPSFAQALEDFATAIMSDTMPLEGAPADWRMLLAKVTRADGSTVSCTIASAGESPPADISAAGAVYTAPQMGGPSLTFQGACALAPGDEIDVSVICAR
jgi:hypothetical protein